MRFLLAHFSCLLRSLWVAVWLSDVSAIPPVLCYLQTTPNHFPVPQGELDQPVVHWVLLQVIFEDRSLQKFFLCFFFHAPVQVTMIVQRQSNGPAMLSASSLSTFGCIPFKPMNSHKSSLLKYSVTLSSSTKGMSFLLQNFPLSPGPWIAEG